MGVPQNTKHFIFWLCNMKQSNFRHFNTNRKNFIEMVNFFWKEAKTAPKRPILFCLVCQGVFGISTTIPYKSIVDFRRLSNISED